MQRRTRTKRFRFFLCDLCVLGGKKGLIYAVHNDYVSTRSHYF